MIYFVNTTKCRSLFHPQNSRAIAGLLPMGCRFDSARQRVSPAETNGIESGRERERDGGRERSKRYVAWELSWSTAVCCWYDVCSGNDGTYVLRFTTRMLLAELLRFCAVARKRNLRRTMLTEIAIAGHRQYRSGADKPPLDCVLVPPKQLRTLGEG